MSMTATSVDAADTQTRRPKTRWTRWRIIKWAIRVSVVAFIVGYLVFVGFDGWFYYPSDTVYERPETYGLAYEEVRFETADGLTLAGWFFPAARGEPRGTIVHFHGNAANISGHLGLVAWLPFERYNLLMFDYRGYGDSAGKVTRAGTISDGHAALDYALSRPDVRKGPVYFYGQSLGGAVAIVVAADRPEVSAVVAESTFGSYRQIAARHLRGLVLSESLANGMAVLLVSAGHDPLDVVDRIAPRPLLIVVAEDDQTCFPELGRAVFDAAGEPKEFWSAPGAGHLAILVNHATELPERIMAFLDEARRP